MAPKKKKSDHDANWQYCQGKRLLIQDIRAGRYPEDMHWTVIFAQRPEFDVGESHEEAKRLFNARLKAARDRVKEDDNRAGTELDLLRQDRAVRPPPPVDAHTGQPRWHGSAAEAFLKQDVADKKHETMDRWTFYYSRPEYQLFEQTTISKHVDQEVRLVKFLKDYGKHRKKKN